MAELVDAADSKSAAFGVWVQVPLRVQLAYQGTKKANFENIKICFF